MAENIKVAREYSRLERNMNVPLVGEYFYVRTLGNRSAPYDIRCRQLDSQNSRGWETNIPPRLSIWQTAKWLLLTYQHNCNIVDMSMGNVFRQVSSLTPA